MRYTVAFAPAATTDLQNLFDYMANHAGERIARDYVTRIHAYCLGFEAFPNRGISRDDLMSGLRIVGFRRQASIAFLVEDATVIIIRIFHRGRNIDVMPEPM